MKLNLNDNIKVKLTDLGKDIYYHQYDNLNAAYGVEICKPKYPKVDEDGYTTFQLWTFIELYGSHIGMGLPNVIEPIEIVFDVPTAEKRKTMQWIPHTSIFGGLGEKVYTCSECGYNIGFHTENYCPRCGKIREEKSNESTVLS